MVDYDALIRSLTARMRPLEDRVRAVEDILDGLDARIERTAAQLRDEARAEVILRRALTAGSRPPSPRHAARRDRHGLYLVRGMAVAAAVCAARWPWRIHRAVIAGGVLAVARHVLGW